MSAVLAAVLLPLIAVPLQAQERPEGTPAASASDAPRSDPNGWQFAVIPYGWFTAVSGTTSAKGISAPVDASFGDIVNNLNMAAMGQFEVRKGDIGAFANVFYSSLEGGNTAGPFQLGPLSLGPVAVDVSMDLLVADIAVFYRTVDLPLNGGLENGGSRLTIEPYAGARIWNMSGEISIDPRNRTVKRSGSDTWVDAIFGFRSQWEITERWNVSLIADAGAGGSTLTAQGTLLGGYRFVLFEERDANVVIGYRALYDDYSAGSGADEFGMNLTLHGPVVGLSVQF